jgi:hypothetical protein
MKKKTLEQIALQAAKESNKAQRKLADSLKDKPERQSDGSCECHCIHGANIDSYCSLCQPKPEYIIHDGELGFSKHTKNIECDLCQPTEPECRCTCCLGDIICNCGKLGFKCHCQPTKPECHVTCEMEGKEDKYLHSQSEPGSESELTTKENEVDKEFTTDVSLPSLKAYIKDNYGKRCKYFSINCGICQMWLAYDILEENII